MKLQSRQGDSIWYYSQLFNIPTQIMSDANPDVAHRDLLEGDWISIPGYSRYKVDYHGQSLSELSKQYQFPLDAIFALNNELSKSNGDEIYLAKRVDKNIVTHDRPYDYLTLMKDIDELKALYPFIKTRSIGYSVEGKVIPEIRIGFGKKKIHFNAAFHANEWITSIVIMQFINDYLKALISHTKLKGLNMLPFYEQVTLSVVPMVNPDGVDLVIHGPDECSQFYKDLVRINKGAHDYSQWKANVRGVDLNDQFPADWEIESKRKPQTPSPRDYPGNEPLSEPESQAMAKLTRNSQFDRVIACHTQGKEIYWGYEGYEPSTSKDIVNEFSKVSGYKAVQYLDSYAGYKDWFIQDYRKPGFTIELGEGENPLPLSQFDEIYHDSLGIFLASLYM